MKKYGECLFAVSKTAKRNAAANQAVIDISDQTSTGEIAMSGISEDGTPTASEPGKNFDDQGNLNHRGKIFINYLKAKCLCKLKRYSESLFTLARITSVESYVNGLSERQYLKVILYKGVDLFYIKQYMEAVLTINNLLQRLASQQRDLLEESTIREGDFSEEEVKQRIESRKALAKMLIQAYSYRGKANQQL